MGQARVLVLCVLPGRHTATMTTGAGARDSEGGADGSVAASTAAARSKEHGRPGAFARTRALPCPAVGPPQLAEGKSATAGGRNGCGARLEV